MSHEHTANRGAAGRAVAALLLVVSLLAPGVPAAFSNTYAVVGLSDLELEDFTLPERAGRGFGYSTWRAPRWPYIVLEGEGEAYMASRADDGRRNPAWAWVDYDELLVALHLKEETGEARGTLFIRPGSEERLQAVPFTLDLADAEATSRAAFLQVKEDHYARLLAQPIPGAAHFRHEMNQARRQRLELASEEAQQFVEEQNQSARRGEQRARAYENQLQRSFAFVTGGRALAENLPLDMELQVASEQAPTVDIATIEGITVPEVEWADLLPEKSPALDELARYIPADQYACLFPSFEAMLSVIDETTRMGTPIVQLAQPRAQDRHVRARYERQLCLQLDALTRQLGPRLIERIAVTGSDPYFPTGTDVAVLFQTSDAKLLERTLLAKRELALQTEAGAKGRGVKIRGTIYTGVVTPDRRISSYVFRLSPDVVAVTNSPHQIERLLAVQRDEATALASLDEFAYFRSEYALGDAEETAFLVATDAAIRRWASPHWRVGTSRRTRAAAHLSDIVAGHAGDLLRGEVEAADLMETLPVPDSGTLRMTETGPLDSVYGSLEFLTPVAELNIESVTQAEAEGYEWFRRSYMSRWGQNFDPIAARLTLREDRIGMGLTGMPVTVRSDYRMLMEVTGDTKLSAEAGDPHEEAILHAVLALDPESEPVEWANNFLRMVNPQASSPLTKWLGESLVLYVDDSTYIDELLAAESALEYLQNNAFRMPIAAEVEVTSLPAATFFLTSLRTYMDRVVPNALVWEPREHNGASYVQVRFREQGGSPMTEQLHIYYHLAPRSLTISLDEGMLQQAIERKQAQAAALVDATTEMSGTLFESASHRLGESFTMEAKPRLLDLIRAFSDDAYMKTMQRRSWANLPILSEYRRLHPERDPVQVYEELWGATLLCPGGGSFTWDAEFHTMQSTAFGHPGEPKRVDDYPEAIRAIERANFGMTFEHDGLQAEVVLHRRDAE